jgi:membrane-associated protease RseP (regulator of RpoE activity)
MTVIYDDHMDDAKDLRRSRSDGKQPRSWVLEGALLAILLVFAALILPIARKNYFLNNLVSRGGRVEFQMMEHAWFKELTGSELPDYFRTVVALDLTETQGLTDNEIRATRMFPHLEALYLMNSELSRETVLDFAERKELAQLLIRNCPNIDLATVNELQSLRTDMTVYFRSTAFLGVYGASVETQECRILQVEAGSAADRFGIRHGDVVKTLDGETVADFEQLVAMLGLRSAGDHIRLVLDRRGEEVEVEVTLGGWMDGK